MCADVVEAVPQKSSTKGFVLKPFVKAEAISLDEAAEEAGVARSTVRTWSSKFGIGRVVTNKYMVSRVALAMLLDDDENALSAYLRGDRSSPHVTAYFDRFGIPAPASLVSAG